MPYIVIDPGHGGKDSGATCFSLAEKNVVLNISKKINNYFGLYEGVNVFLTRWDDRFLELNERAAFANNKKCDCSSPFTTMRPAPMLMGLNHSSIPMPARQRPGIKM